MRPYQSRVVSRRRPMGLFHFVDPRHWTPHDAQMAFNQGTQALLDEVVMTGFRVARTRRSERRLREINTESRAALAVYEREGWLDDPTLAYPKPRAPQARQVHVESATFLGLNYERVRFLSSYRPHPDDPSSARWQSFEANRNVHAWVLRHREPRPWVVGVHGAEMGRPSIDLSLFKARWMHEKLGLNVALPVLPMHGPRRDGGAHYPSEVVAHNVHGLLQSVADVRRTLAWIRRQQPGQPIGMHGISLGGYTTAMVASLEENLACAVVGVAPMDLVLLLERHHGSGHGRDLRVQNFEVGAILGQMMTPLKLTPKLPRHSRYFYAGVVDRLVDFADHIAPMIAHWDYPKTLVFDGGHVGIGLSREIQPFLAMAFAESGLTEPLVQSAPISSASQPA